MRFWQNYPQRFMIFIGLLLTLIGLILMPVPGPGGTPVFLAGLAILATKFKWAQKFIVRFKEAYGRMGKRKRRILTTSLILFYLASGVLVWNWASR